MCAVDELAIEYPGFGSIDTRGVERTIREKVEKIAKEEESYYFGIGLGDGAVIIKYIK
jgi:hypothetical protein